MKDDSLSDVQKEFKMIKRGDCRCICHNDFGPTVMHIMPCCETDDNLKVPLDMSKANCPHGIAMDIYCKKCYFENLKASSPSIVDEQIIYGGRRNSGKMSVWDKSVWNAAIEAAAEKCISLSEQDDWSPGYKRSAQVIAAKLKELKK